MDTLASVGGGSAAGAGGDGGASMGGLEQTVGPNGFVSDNHAAKWGCGVVAVTCGTWRASGARGNGVVVPSHGGSADRAQPVGDGARDSRCRPP